MEFDVGFSWRNFIDQLLLYVCHPQKQLMENGVTVFYSSGPGNVRTIIVSPAPGVYQ
jgi:hypothetical protein